MASEIEFKFSVHPEFDELPLFTHRLIHPYKQKVYHHYYRTFYLDTEDGYASQLGISMRLRVEDDIPYLYAKTTISRVGALSIRKEWRVRSSDLTTAAAKPAFRGAPTKPLVGKELFVTGSVEFDRMDCKVCPRPGFSFLMVYDRGRFDLELGFGELEFELCEGEIAELQEIIDVLTSELQMFPEPRSKHQRAIEYAGGKKCQLPKDI